MSSDLRPGKVIGDTLHERRLLDGGVVAIKGGFSYSFGESRGCLSKPIEAATKSLAPATGKLEPVTGFEPVTCCLRNSCSTTELHWR